MSRSFRHPALRLFDLQDKHTDAIAGSSLGNGCSPTQAMPTVRCGDS